MNVVKIVRISAVALFVLAGASIGQTAPIISVHFDGSSTQGVYSLVSAGGNGFNGPGVTGVAGAIPVGNYNNAPGYSSSLSGLVEDNSGTPTTTLASVSYSGANVYNAYQNTPPTSTQDYVMMGGYLDSQPGTNISITVSGLGSEFTASGYEVLLYRNTDSSGVTGYSITDNNSNTNSG